MHRGQGSILPQYQFSPVSIIPLFLSRHCFPKLQWPSDSTSTKTWRFSHGHQLMMMLVLYSVIQNRRTLWASSVLVRFKVWLQLDFFLFVKHNAMLFC